MKKIGITGSIASETTASKILSKNYALFLAQIKKLENYTKVRALKFL